MPAKDFGPIESDYAFFMAHSTESENDLAHYVRALDGFAQGRESIRFLDFGCGAGDFSQEFLSAMNWEKNRLKISLVEPVEQQRHTAAERLSNYTSIPIRHAGAPTTDLEPPFDLVVSNHVLYYVDDLEPALDWLIRSLSSTGRLLLTMADQNNLLLRLWKIGFSSIGQDVPYFTAEDVEAVLKGLGQDYQASESPYQLRFPDTAENRLKILRFLFGSHLESMDAEMLRGCFDDFADDNYVDVETYSLFFELNANGA